MLSLLTLAYGEYAKKKFNVFEWQGEKMCKITQRVGTQKCNGQITNLSVLSS
jgi:hypothetical protein